MCCKVKIRAMNKSHVKHTNMNFLYAYQLFAPLSRTLRHASVSPNAKEDDGYDKHGVQWSFSKPEWLPLESATDL